MPQTLAQYGHPEVHVSRWKGAFAPSCVSWQWPGLAAAAFHNGKQIRRGTRAHGKSEWYLTLTPNQNGCPEFRLTNMAWYVSTSKAIKQVRRSLTLSLPKGNEEQDTYCKGADVRDRPPDILLPSGGPLVFLCKDGRMVTSIPNKFTRNLVRH